MAVLALDALACKRIDPSVATDLIWIATNPRKDFAIRRIAVGCHSPWQAVQHCLTTFEAVFPRETGLERGTWIVEIFTISPDGRIRARREARYWVRVQRVLPILDARRRPSWRINLVPGGFTGLQ